MFEFEGDGFTNIAHVVTRAELHSRESLIARSQLLERNARHGADAIHLRLVENPTAVAIVAHGEFAIRPAPWANDPEIVDWQNRRTLMVTRFHWPARELVDARAVCNVSDLVARIRVCRRATEWIASG